MSKVKKTGRCIKYKCVSLFCNLSEKKKDSRKKKKVLDTEKVVWYYIKAVREAAVYLVN